MHAKVKVFLEVTPHLESKLANEISSHSIPKTSGTSQLSIGHVERGSGGFEVSCSTEHMWWIIHRSKLAGSARLRIGDPFRSQYEKEFEKGFSRLQWPQYLPYLSPSAKKSKIDVDTYFPKISVTCHSSSLYHTGLVKEIVQKHLRQAIYSKLPYNVITPPEDADQDEIPKLFVRIQDNVAQVSLDAGGMLYKRTKDKHVSSAPLRETLAAACLYLADYSEDRTLWDPFCGAGTILIEGMKWSTLNSIITSNNNQYQFRTYPFEHWKSHPTADYAEFLTRMKEYQNEVNTNLLAKSGIKFIGSDIDKKCIEACKHNMSTLEQGLQNQAKFIHGDFEKVDPTLINKNTMIVTNAPYGQRIENSPQLIDTFVRFGQYLKANKELKDVFVLNGHPTFEQITSLQWEVVEQFWNRGKRVNLLKLSKR